MDWLPQPRELVRHGILATLSNEECARLLTLIEPRECEAGDVLLRQGETSQNLWIVLQGKFRIVRSPEAERGGEAIRLATIESGEVFGEMSFFHPAPHSASVIAEAPAKVLRLSRSAYDQLVEEGSNAAYKIARNTILSLAERLRRMDTWVVELLHSGQAPAEFSRLRDMFTGDWVL